MNNNRLECYDHHHRHQRVNQFRPIPYHNFYIALLTINTYDVSLYTMLNVLYEPPVVQHFDALSFEFRAARREYICTLSTTKRFTPVKGIVEILLNPKPISVDSERILVDQYMDWTPATNVFSISRVSRVCVCCVYLG